MDFKISSQPSDSEYGFQVMGIFDIPRKILKLAENNRGQILQNEFSELDKILAQLKIEK